MRVSQHTEQDCCHCNSESFQHMYISSPALCPTDLGPAQYLGSLANSKISSSEAELCSHCGREWVVRFFSASVPICMYRPNRPDRTITGLPDKGSSPIFVPAEGGGWDAVGGES
jgi:hypothetical protein